MAEDTSGDSPRDELRIENEAKQLSTLAASNDWQIAKQRLIVRITSATSLLDMPENERRDAALCEARYQAAQIVAEWIKEIDGEELLHDKIEADTEEPDHILRTG